PLPTSGTVRQGKRGTSCERAKPLSWLTTSIWALRSSALASRAASRSPASSRSSIWDIREAASLSTRQTARHLHALHVVAGKVAPDEGVADELVGVVVHHAAVGAAHVHVDLGHLLHGVGREVHREAGVEGVHLVVMLPSDAHDEAAQRLGERLHLA